ncbi:MAG: ester cyclase [Nitrososphaerales archaeon]
MNLQDKRHVLDVIERFYRMWTTGDTSEVDTIVAPSYEQNPSQQEQPGRDTFPDVIKGFRTAFPDLNATITHVLVDGDYVQVRGEWTGTHAGELSGMPATGKKVSFVAFDLHRVENGLIAQTWHLEDFNAILTQLRSETAL